MADQTTLDVLVRAQADQRSIADVEKDFKSLQRRLKDMGVDWGKVSKQASAFTTELRTISDAAGTFVKKLGSATTDSLKELGKLSNQLDEAHDKAKELSEAYEKAAPGAKEGIAKEMAEQAKAIAGITQMVNAERVARGKEVQQLAKLMKAQERYQRKVQEAAKFDMGDMWSGVKDKISSGNFKGIFSEFGGGLKKSIEGKIARGGMEKAMKAGGAGTEAGAAEMAGAASKMAAAGAVIAVAAAGFVVFVELVKAASSHMTGLNKTLIQGMGFANDMVSDAKGYRGVMDEFRNAAVDAHGSMLRFGKNSEDYLKVINAYAKTSTGSLIQTRAAMGKLGNFEDVAKSFVESSIMYGKALNMEAEEVAGMMGSFQTEMGYGANQVQELMNGVVQAARTASMPMSKFMEIFKQVTPDVELYRNRLEELTGTIKLLSKTMSPRDVKQFMDAFSKGFGGTDFKQRLKTVFVAGIGNVNSVLEKGFKSRASTMASKLGADQKEFVTAMKGGEKGMAAMLNKLQAQGKQLSGTDIGEAMKLSSYEAARGKGGPLNMATALRGASSGETYQILKKMSQRFGTGFDGLNEHVIAQLGISEQQYLAMRQTNQSMEVWGDQIRKTGMTSSKSLNDGIEKRMKALGKTMSDFKKMSGDDQERILFEASQEHEDAMGAAKTMDDLAQEQVSATTSISDKISNVIAFLLEKLYNVLQPILDLLDDVWSWLTGTGKQKDMMKEMKAWRDDSVKVYDKAAQDLAAQAALAKDPQEKKRLQQESAKQAAMAEETRMFGQKVEKGISSGKSAEEVARGALDPEMIANNMRDIEQLIRSSGATLSQDESTRLRTLGGRKKGAGYSQEEIDFTRGLVGKGGVGTIMTAGRMQVEKGGPTAEAAARAGYRGATRRAGTEELSGPKTKKEAEAARLAAEASDVDPRFRAAYPGTTPDVAAPDVAAPGAAPKPSNEATAPLPPTEKAKMVVEAAKAASGGAGEPAPAVSEQLSLSEDTAKAAKVQSDVQTRILAAIESGNSQLMGISVHTDDIDKHLDKVQLLKNKFLNDIVGGGQNFKDTLSGVLEDKLTFFLFALLIGLDKKNEGWAGANAEGMTSAGIGISTLAMRPIWGEVEDFGRVKPGTFGARGAKDFGGDVPVTGEYRLQQGETVLPRGASTGKTTTVNATINVSGAGDPQSVAIAVRNELYRLSNRP